VYRLKGSPAAFVGIVYAPDEKAALKAAIKEFAIIPKEQNRFLIRRAWADMAIDATQRLAEYWFRARLMHDLLHALMEAYDDDLRAIDKDGHSWEFLTYLDYWLSALFVVVEGFNKLKLKDARVQRLFSPHVSQLKELRRSGATRGPGQKHAPTASLALVSSVQSFGVDPAR
jgi:hypothetical protein